MKAKIVVLWALSWCVFQGVLDDVEADRVDLHLVEGARVGLDDGGWHLFLLRPG